MFWSAFAPCFWATKKLYYAFQDNWKYWAKGKKNKAWSGDDYSREEYERMLERVAALKPKKTKEGPKKKRSKGVKRRIRGQAKGPKAFQDTRMALASLSGPSCMI